MAHRPSRRVLILLAALLFALGGLAHGLAAAEMTTDMTAMAASEAPAHEHCGACADAGDMAAASAACHALCASPNVLVVTSSDLAAARAAHLPVAPSAAPPGRTGRPEPHPPRPALQS